VDIFVELGARRAFGLLGGSVAPLYDALARSRLGLVHCRHESGAAFAAIESYFTSGHPAVVFATTGPGITNSITGIAAARWEGAKMIFVTGTTSAAQRGRWAFQETSPYTMPGFFTAGGLFDYAVAMEDPEEIDQIAVRLAAGLSRPGRFVAGIAVPVGLQMAEIRRRTRKVRRAGPMGCDPRVVVDVARRLAGDPFVIWVGFGARAASVQVRALAERMGAMVMSTPRGKGIFPEDHPQYLGVTGLGGHARVKEFLSSARPSRTLVLGTRLGEFSSFWDPDFIPMTEFIHVDVDGDVPGVAFPTAQTYAVHAEIGAFLDGLLRETQPRDRRPRGVPASDRPPPGEMPAQRVRTSALFEAIQRGIVDVSDAVVMSEAGNSFAWATNALRFRRPDQYRVSVGFGSMGHATTGVIGAALGRNGKAVAVVGDGAMLMANELSTAVSHDIPAVWIIMNNARYEMTHGGMMSVGLEPTDTEIVEVDFAMVARGIGAKAIRVEREADLDEALRVAMAASGPFVVDVLLERDEQAPMTKRNKLLLEQWSHR
jgi:acetolactate synthase-1/2/3 large subunit